MFWIFISWWWAVRGGEKKGEIQFFSSCKSLLLFSPQTSLAGEKSTLGAVLPQNPSALEPAAVGGEAASKPANSVKPACPASTSPLNWLADLTSGNVNKENKGECFLLSYWFWRTCICPQRDLAAPVVVKTEWLEVMGNGTWFPVVIPWPDTDASVFKVHHQKGELLLIDRLEILGPGIEPMSQEQPKLLQWRCQILDLLRQRGLQGVVLKLKKWGKGHVRSHKKNKIQYLFIIF